MSKVTDLDHAGAEQIRKKKKKLEDPESNLQRTCGRPSSGLL